MEVLRVIDFGDAAVLPSDPVRSHAAIERTVGQVVSAGAIPIILGGDHSITEPNVKAVRAKYGPMALVHFDTHTDTGHEVFGVEISHGTPMYRLVRDGHVDGAHYVQIGLRGYWPGEREFGWQAEHGITSFFMHDVRDAGSVRSSSRRLRSSAACLHSSRSTSMCSIRPLRLAPARPNRRNDECRSALGVSGPRRRTGLVGMDVVEVLPTGVASADITALVAERVVRETLTGIAIGAHARGNEPGALALQI